MLPTRTKKLETRLRLNILKSAFNPTYNTKSKLLKRDMTI